MRRARARVRRDSARRGREDCAHQHPASRSGTAPTFSLNRPWEHKKGACDRQSGSCEEVHVATETTAEVTENETEAICKSQAMKELIKRLLDRGIDVLSSREQKIGFSTQNIRSSLNFREKSGNTAEA